MAADECLYRNVSSKQRKNNNKLSLVATFLSVMMISLTLLKRSAVAFSTGLPTTTTRRFLIDHAATKATASFAMIRRSFSCCEAVVVADNNDEIEEETPSSSASSLSIINDDDSSNQQKCFQVTAKYEPTGDQPQAIEQLVRQLQEGDRFSILRGMTGTGKTLVMANVIAAHGKPTLVLCHNKTLAAQLARELRSFLRENAVELFVSYYNHYVPESFVESTGKYISKKSSVNAEIDALRHRATRALMTRRDVVVVASVSCIYGLGLPKEYLEASTEIQVGDVMSWDDLMGNLDGMLYTCNDNDDDFDRGQYQLSTRVNLLEDSSSDIRTVTLWSPHESFPMQIELERTTRNNLFRINAIREGSQEGLNPVTYTRIFPAKHHVISDDRLTDACIAIEDEMRERVQELTHQGKTKEAHRLQQRVINDLMMLRETGFCSGGENYSRHFAGRQAGEPPDTLMDYFGLHGDDWLLMVDESHVALPQLKAMYGGDQSRKRRLVKHGYRLPSALDNRPLHEEEFWDQVQQTVFVSATPSKQELYLAERDPVEMVIRPTFVCDPIIEVRPPEGQLEDLLREVRTRAEKHQRTLAVALTKRDAEDLASYFLEQGVRSTYIHSGLSTTERSDALRALQTGDIDCLVGVNLLREGLDLPQVSLVAILNADSDGFLRSETALLQTVGRAARNIHGKAIFYARRISESMKKCMDDTDRRRKKQLKYNERFGCEMRSTIGSSTLSIFDLLKDQIQAEQPLEVVGRKKIKPNLDEKSSDLKGIVQRLAPRRIGTKAEIETDHIPNSPGIYIWKDENDKFLYIGKAVKLRSRIKSYLSTSAKHSARINTMLQKASSVEFVLTPSDRDALVLESNLIKHHQPPFNVLLKDDEHYPYICASVGDTFPRFYIVPRKEENASNRRYRYFGPYTSFKEINAILEGIEEKYDLRAQSFLARHGSGSKQGYQKLFDKALNEVFSGRCGTADSSLNQMRSQFEEAGMLFDSQYNRCRDVVAVARTDATSSTVIVHVLQLRSSPFSSDSTAVLVAGRFSYTCDVPFGLETDEDSSSVIQTVLEKRHYPSGEESANGRFSWFPDDILLSHPPVNANGLKNVIVQARKEVEQTTRTKTLSITTAAKKGPRKIVDARALEFASKNAQQIAHERALASVEGSTLSSLDGTASAELATLLSLENEPTRIECYDISHTQGDFPVGSRVVFIGGRPAPELYRRFNVKTVQGVDDYASLEEIIERRFRRAWVNGSRGPVDKNDPWALPDLVLIDGGRGQLHAAVKGMSKACIFPIDPQSKNGSDPFLTEKEDRRATVAVCALAKGQEQLFVHGRKEPVNEAPDTPALLLLRSLRDESHRFALSNHRKRRSLRKT